MERNDTGTTRSGARGAAPEGPKIRRKEGGRLPSAPRPVRRGIAVVWTALLLIVLVGVLGVGLDFGKAAWNIHQLHNAADAAALAGAQIVKGDPSGAAVRAHDLALVNDADGLAVTLRTTAQPEPFTGRQDDYDILVGRWIRQWADYPRTRDPFVPIRTGATAVRAAARRGQGWGAEAPRLRYYWGPVFDVNGVDVLWRAIAWSRGSTGAGILLLAAHPEHLPGWNHDTGLLMDGGTILDLRGADPVTGEPLIGDVQINATSESSPWAAFRLNGNSAEIWTGEFNVVGGTNPPATATSWQGLYGDPAYPFSVNPDSPRIEDPLAAVAPPNISTMPAGSDATGKTYYDPVKKTFETISGGDLTLNPGYYPGGIDMSGGSLVLNPGVYAFGGAKAKNNGPGLVLSGGASVTGSGVLLYITGDPTGKITGTKTEYGRIDLGGNGAVEITSRGDAMTPRQIDGEMGIALWQDRANSNYGRIIGTADSHITGTIYCGYNALEIGGTSEQMGNQVIAGALQLHGTPELHIAYDGRNEVEGHRSILVQ